MRILKPAILAGATLGILLSTGVRPSSAGPCFDQPHMAATVQALNSAIAFLRKAENDNGGWRELALADANEALSAADAGCAAGNGK
jgi:hypothetical protein